MAMNASDLSDNLYDRLKTGMPGLADRPDSELVGIQVLCDAIAEEVIDHIKEYAVVSSSTIAVNGGSSGLAPYAGPVAGAVGALTDGKIT